jgi:UDP-N-acetylmuramoyl-tripeptide--D-alanyl-D-alanine ligase
MKFIKSIFHLFSPDFPRTVVYMLQSVEYEVEPYLKWLWRVSDFSGVMHRRTLDKTMAARKLLGAMYTGMIVQYALLLALLYWAVTEFDPGLIVATLVLFIATPIFWAHVVTLPLVLARWLIVKPQHAKQIHASAHDFSQHTATIIAVAGSYGKTTMKELLLTVLAEGKKVAGTPANKNVAISHARFVKTLKGDEEILVIEYGEGKPGDVKKFAKTTRPDIGVITGLAPAHLDKYGTLEEAGKDIFALGEYLGKKPLYVNIESPEVVQFIKSSYITYSSTSVAGWKISDINLSIEGLGFVMQKDKTKLSLKSQLLGKHQVGPLAAVAAIAFELGMKPEQIEAGIAKTKPFEHRMQPYQVNDAWIIDDTYNGNIEGLKSGLSLLAALPAKRKIYITPGLVDQGVETKNVHTSLGQAIAESNPDEVVLMKNSVTKYIKRSMEASGYGGKLVVVDDPLDFYTNLGSYVASGDLVLMQNDWTDNYA